jgi:hypothetical protein
MILFPSITALAFAAMAASGATADPLSAPPKAPARKVLIIGIDGMRADAFRRADAPNLKALADSGALSMNAVTDVVARSGPGWTSVLTGVWGWKHGVKDNGFAGYREAAHPTFLERAKALRPDLNVGAVVNWKPIGTHLFGRSGFWVAPGGDEEVVEESISLIGRGVPDLLFVHLDAVDHAGHTFGFSPYVPFYMWAVEKVDAMAGRIVRAARAREGEDWLILVTSDHGGNFRHHGDNIPSDRLVILVANGTGCKPVRPKGFRGVVDVAPTAFAFLGLPVDPAWNWDGKPLGYMPAADSARARFAAAAAATDRQSR